MGTLTLCQGLTTLSVKNFFFFLILNLNLSWCNSKPFPCALLLVSKEESWKRTGREGSKVGRAVVTQEASIYSLQTVK